MTSDELALVERVSQNWGSNEVGLLVALVRRLDAENERQSALLRELSDSLGPAPENVGCAQNSAINLADRLEGKA